jgi:hypothetical protein
MEELINFVQWTPAALGTCLVVVMLYVRRCFQLLVELKDMHDHEDEDGVRIWYRRSRADRLMREQVTEIHRRTHGET